LRPPLAALGLAALLAALLAACGGGTGSASGNRITVSSVPGIGTVLANGAGRTVYVYAPDAHTGTSRCTAACAVLWPPVVLSHGATGPVAGSGVDTAALGTTARADGSVQVTYHGWPLYTWTADTGPHMARGQGLDNEGGYWYAIRPSGGLVILVRGA